MKGDQEWIVSALERLEQPLVRYVFGYLRDADRSREVVQEAFLRLCVADRSAVEGHVKEWLYKVCRNQALDLVKGGRRPVPLNSAEDESSQVRLSSPPPETPSVVVERGLQAARVSALIEGLSDDQQEAIRLKFQEGMSYAEISAVTGHSVSNVGFLIHAGIKKVRERLRALREGSYGGP